MKKLVFGDRGILQIDDAKLIYKNFAGDATKFNREGDRNFAVVIDTDEQWDALRNDVSKDNMPWNVKSKPALNEGDPDFRWLPVKVKYNTESGPTVYLQSGVNRTKLTQKSIAILDSIDILRVDLDIRPYDGEINGNPFRSAYLKSMLVIQDVDRFASDDFDINDDDSRYIAE